ncbi:MAG: hypothetical protein ACYS21_17660, partial [Planctomycetota bacterium]
TDAGWDFVTRIWKMCDGQYYPGLWWEICSVRPILYVDKDATGAYDGSSWADACTKLDHALYIARYGDEIRVAQGTYKPAPISPPPPPPPPLIDGSNQTQATVTDSNRPATFQLKNGVFIKGGYAGLGKPNPNVRDIVAYETILSGDLAGNDRDVNDPLELYNDPCRADNCYHVVTGSDCDESAVLDGFTITAGNANDSYPDDSGGGMYNNNGSPMVTNCTFSGNSAYSNGGGMLNWQSSPTITKCTFCYNQAYNGSGMHNYEGSPNVTNCTFTENSARSSGAGIENYRSSPTIMNCRISENSAGGYAGMCNYWSNATITNCEFIGNSSTYMGGGMGNTNSNTRLTNCRFSGNTGSLGGGVVNSGLHDSGESQILINCYFSENSATIDGGGFYNGFKTSAVLTNCTFSKNSAEQYGGGISTKTDGTLVLTNCILWGNTASGASQIYGGTNSVTVNYSDVQGGWPGAGEGNIDADPCFADADNSDCHLKSKAGRWDPNSQTWVKDKVSSPCIDAGDWDSDWTAELWPNGKRINMGAYGGTPEASMSLSDAGNIADLNLDGQLCNRDIKLLTDKWLCETLLLPEDLSRDGIVNFTDFAIFAHDFELPARNPNPADGAKSVNITADLSWTPGRGATSHDVYFYYAFGAPPAFIGNQTSTTFDPNMMYYSTTYYWRIDEINK